MIKWRADGWRNADNGLSGDVAARWRGLVLLVVVGVLSGSVVGVVLGLSTDFGARWVMA